jgi:hypothetical protein
MTARKVLVYYAWSRPRETGARLEIIENRFPALFESRRMAFPKFEEFSDPARFNQGIAGFLDHIMKHNFTGFVELAAKLTGRPVVQIERGADDGGFISLHANALVGVDTVIVISFDSLPTGQQADSIELDAVRSFLTDPDHLIFICPHHDIGDAAELTHDERLARQIGEFHHHGDKTIPPQQQFGGFARSLLAGLGVPVENRFGLRPAGEADGSPAPIEIETALDRFHFLDGVRTFNLHPHLPQLDRVGEGISRLDVLARQKIDPGAPLHPVMRNRPAFDALLQSREDAFAGTVLVSDTTLWSSTAGGLESLHRFWTNVIQRPHRK